MPTYEYECANGHTFEVVQRITEDALTQCQECDAAAHRLISATNFILKGSGWYSDGYSGGGSPGGSSEKKPTPSSDSSASTSDSSSKTSTSDSTKSSSSNSSD